MQTRSRLPATSACGSSTAVTAVANLDPLDNAKAAVLISGDGWYPVGSHPARQAATCTTHSPHRTRPRHCHPNTRYSLRHWSSILKEWYQPIMSKQPQQPAVTGTGPTRGHTCASPPDRQEDSHHRRGPRDDRAAVPLGRFYEGEDDEARTGAVRGFLEFRGVTPGPEASTGELLVAALGSYPPMGWQSARCRRVRRARAPVFGVACRGHADGAATAADGAGGPATHRRARGSHYRLQDRGRESQPCGATPAVCAAISAAVNAAAAVPPASSHSASAPQARCTRTRRTRW